MSARFRGRLPSRLSWAIAVAAVAVAPVSAQEADTTPPPAHVSVVDGAAVLERDAVIEEVSPNLPVVPGERLRTERGRVELLFGDGSLVHMDGDTELELLSDTLIRMTSGRVAVVTAGGTTTRFQVDTPGGSARLGGAGEYRLALLDRGGADELELAVVRGTAEISTEAGSVLLRAGERALAREGEQPSPAVPWNSARWDAFDRWSQDRLDARRSRSAHQTGYQYVPPVLRPYAPVLDTWGYWGHEAAYGYVWFPRVAVGWRPYYHGRWRFVFGFGWTWIGADVWAWPTHHYGRWGITPAGAWYWIPGRAWGPGWVHWGYSGRYVSWCPLGWNNRPIVGWWGPSYRRVHHAYDPWRAWTVVPREHFGSRRVVSGYAIDARRFSNSPSSFVLQDRPPAVLAPQRRPALASGSPGRIGTAVPRGGEPSSISAGTGRSRRSGVPSTPSVAGSAGVAAGSGRGGPAEPAGAIRRGSPAPPIGSAAAAPGERPGPPGEGARRRYTLPPAGSGATITTPRSSYRVYRPEPGAAAGDAPRGRETLPPPAVERRGAAPRGSPGETTPGWRREQVPVHRGGLPPAEAPPVSAAPERSRRSDTRALPSPSYGSGSRGDGPSERAAPPERYGGRTRGDDGSPRTAAPRGGWSAPPASPPPSPPSQPRYEPAPHRASPPSAGPGPSRGGDGGGGRQAPSRGGDRGGGGSGGHAVPRGGARPRG